MVVKSKFTVNTVEVPLHALFLAKCAEYGDRPALVDATSERSYSFNDLENLSRRIGSALTRQGARKGDLMVFYCENCPEYVLMFYACLRLGVIVSGANPLCTVYEMTHHLKDSKADFIFSIKSNVSRTKKAAVTAGSVRKTFILGEEHGCVSFSRLLGDDGSALPEVSLNPREDVAAVPYSSGTTGLPKGVMLTHFNIVSNILQFSHESFKSADELANSGDLVVLSVIPFFHAYGMLILLMTSMAGMKLVTLPRFIPDKFLAAIGKYKVTHLPLVPPLIVFLAKSPLVAKYDLSSIRKVNSGAASLGKEVENEFMRRLKVPQMKQGYGMTETTTVATAPHPATHKPGSVGMLVPNMEARIVDPETKQEKGVGEMGEIFLRGPNIMKGYLNKPQATADILDRDGWLQTGDIGYYDEDELFYITGRLKELIKYKGFQVPPAELEAVILAHPAVEDVAVIGLPDVTAGEIPRAFVVRKDGAKLTADEVTQFVQERVSPYKRLRGGVQFVQGIPKTASGKIIRREVAKLMSKSKL